ncbi:hypothetical protein MJO28_011829 [Puccinia striiformis f. sp. tritici]|nr:hypothetical protein Pst134EA_021401 [Puccinia striiformis f. sp. tritici]POW00859.1 hypothetical protein PSHT_12837 [Puccinia striiformis]KAH9448283.1 hypothetical protein Pst134EB_022269 [Puccinia striiformis f. sp. tritici]KAH9457527.1 hypothetical protein Pst134EA_021401 [Puccinia striiformis f. sp. tritici]KAI7944301.1 hypothetical protein MJO28_011829 [Puccinia striiformis f. sp. tritici]KAI7947063.1 hypothetical protein MJO29_011590 [Puccinia striiformis f. sp. tritici]
MATTNSKPFNSISAKSFKNPLSMKTFIKALPVRKAPKSINGSLKSESFSTIDFSTCVMEDQVAHKLSHPNLKDHNTPPQSVTMMTFSKVVDIFEELEPRPEITKPKSKPRSRTRRHSFLKMKTKKSSRPNTALDSIISNRLLACVLEPLSASADRKVDHCDHLAKSRTELLLKEETSQSSHRKSKTLSAREKRLKYCLYHAPLDSFQLRRRLNLYGCDEKINRPRLDPSSYAHIMRKEKQRLRIESIAYQNNPRLHKNPQPINNGIRSLKLETIPESVGSWAVTKDPRDPRQRRTKLNYVLTSW